MDKQFDKDIKDSHNNMLSHPEFMVMDEKTTKGILAITYRYLGDIEKSKEMFHYAIDHINKYESRGPEDETEDNKDYFRLINRGEIQLKHGILLGLAGERDRARWQFERAAENCKDAEEHVANEDVVASANLTRGYALLVIGKYEEACPLLQRVTPFFNKYKKHGLSIITSYKISYFLPKLLVPLCEYLLDRTEEKRQDAIRGADVFFGSFKDYSDKFDGLIYYLHMKELFPDAYQEEESYEADAAKKIRDKKGGRSKIGGGKNVVIPLEPDEVRPGFVLIFDKETNYIVTFGNVEDVETYTYKVRDIGDYPGIIGLMESFGFCGEQEPEPLVEECTRLLSTPDLDAFIMEKTLSILKAAQEAKINDNKLMIYFQEE